MTNNSILNAFEQYLETFLKEFIRNPYLCYTEHGLHALFFARLYDALKTDALDDFKGHQVCRVQKEYPTADTLGKSRRQHWDIALLDLPCDARSYDSLPLWAVVEFGLNAKLDHLMDDLARVSHPKANTKRRYVVHLYRLSKSGAKLSSRDSTRGADALRKYVRDDTLIDILRPFSKSGMSSKEVRKVLSDYSVEGVSPETIQLFGSGKESWPVTIYFGVADNDTDQDNMNALHKICGGEYKKLVLS